jgi:hypothetical protein
MGWDVPDNCTYHTNCKWQEEHFQFCLYPNLGDQVISKCIPLATIVAQNVCRVILLTLWVHISHIDICWTLLKMITIGYIENNSSILLDKKQTLIALLHNYCQCVSYRTHIRRTSNSLRNCTRERLLWNPVKWGKWWVNKYHHINLVYDDFKNKINHWKNYKFVLTGFPGFSQGQSQTISRCNVKTSFTPTGWNWMIWLRAEILVGHSIAYTQKISKSGQLNPST